AHVWTKRVHEITAPAELVARRIPNDILEGEYGFLIQTKPVEEGGNGEAIGLKVLGAYAMARGFMRQGQGQPDETRSARLRYVLKEYVNARLLYCHPSRTSTTSSTRFAESRGCAACHGRHWRACSREFCRVSREFHRR
ncbi:unnamed protein product, partial [Tilletia caries]